MKSVIVKTVHELENWFATEKHKNLAVDTETSSSTSDSQGALKYLLLQIDGFSLCNGESKLYCDLVDNKEANQILDVLNLHFSEVETFIMQNAVYDMKVFHKYGITFNHAKLFDTMIADHLLDENVKHGLKEMAKRYLNEEDVIDFNTAASYGKHSERFYQYAMHDAEWTYRIAALQVPQLKQQQLFELMMNVEMPFQFVLLQMEITGIPVDLKEAESERIKLQKKKDEMQLEMYKMIGAAYSKQYNLANGNFEIVSDINFNSSQQLVDILTKKLNLPVTETTESGQLSVGKDTITQLRDKHPFVAKLELYKRYEKLLSSFFNPLPTYVESDGRIRAGFRDVGTHTGRLASSSPNMQQLPKAVCDVCGSFDIKGKVCTKCGFNDVINFRSYFKATAGKKLVGIDFMGQELRVLTEYTKDTQMIDIFTTGKDMHLSNANKFMNLGIPEECLYETHPEFSKYKKMYKKERDKSKTITFGINYRKGAFSFAKDFNITEAEAQKMLDDYFKIFPQLLVQMNYNDNFIKLNGYTKTKLFNRKRRFTPLEKEGKWGRFKIYTNAQFREGFNFLIQGFSSDMMRSAAVAVYKESQKYPQYEIAPLMSIHDEMVYQVSEKYAEESAALIKNAFENCVKLCVPVCADVGVGVRYSDVK